MSKANCTISVAEVRFDKGPKKRIKVNIDGRDVGIPVDGSVFAYFREQFLREQPTPTQKRRFATIMNVLRAAYQKGYRDARKLPRN